MYFGQTFDPHDLIVVGVLIVLEGVLSIDNALVLGLLARRLPKHLQARALTYGLVGAFVFRIIAIATAAYLLEWRIAKLLGGAYLIYVALQHFFLERDSTRKISIGDNGKPVAVDKITSNPLSEFAEITSTNPVEVSRADSHQGESLAKPSGAGGVATAELSTHARLFWMTVAVIELTDIAFAVDSIVAAVGTVPGREKLWIVVTGGMLGVILMRFAAVIFIRLLEKFPRFETAAYLLVIIIGGKLVIDWALNSAEHPHQFDFHSPQSAAFWIFWILMLSSFCIGFIPKSKNKAEITPPIC